MPNRSGLCMHQTKSTGSPSRHNRHRDDYCPSLRYRRYYREQRGCLNATPTILLGNRLEMNQGNLS
ncbi:hypothetical protein HanIR_Chr15g0750501 [Helianthus annuus]|nr:hypothetical protein HanIR_Chr15g0750501 [Helianthus annuus]